MIGQYDGREVHVLYLLKQKMAKGIACYYQPEFFVVKGCQLVRTVFEYLCLESLMFKNGRTDTGESVFVNY